MSEALATPSEAAPQDAVGRAHWYESRDRRIRCADESDRFEGRLVPQWQGLYFFLSEESSFKT